MKIIALVPLFLGLNLLASEEKFSIFKFDSSNQSFEQVGSPFPLRQRKMIEAEYRAGRDTTVWVEEHNTLLVGVKTAEQFLAEVGKRKPQRRKSIAQITAARRAAFLSQGSE